MRTKVYALSAVPDTVKLTPEQQVVLLKINDRVGESDTRTYRYVKEKKVDGWLVRETRPVMALARKGLVNINRANGTATPTLEGYWLHDALRIEARLEDN